MDELLLDVGLELLDAVDRLVRILAEVVGEHLPVDLVLAQLLGVPFAGVFLGDRARGRLGAGHDGDLALEAALHERLVEGAGLIDRVADEHSVAAPTDQPRLGLHVHEDVLDDLRRARCGGEDLLHRAPLLLQPSLRQIREVTSLRLEPLVHRSRPLQLRLHLPRLVLQVQNDTVADALIELVGVDERPKGLDAGLLVVLQQRGAGEADEHRSRK